MKIAALCGAYLAAIVLANLSLSWLGPKMAVVNGFMFVALDLSTRDSLHDAWRGRLIRNMALLIAAGSGLSYVMGLWLGSGPFVGRIALASMIAFGAAATADSIAYHFLRDHSYYERVNGSNAVGAAVDSFVFVALWPFGFQFLYAFSLWTSKLAGGVLWGWLLKRKEQPDKNEWLERNRRLYPAPVDDGGTWNDFSLRREEDWETGQ